MGDYVDQKRLVSNFGWAKFDITVLKERGRIPKS